MDSSYAHAFPHDAFNFEGPAGVHSHAVQPFELTRRNDPIYDPSGLYDPSFFVDPALVHAVPHQVPMEAVGFPHPDNATVHPAALQYGHVMPSQLMGAQPVVDSPVSRPGSSGNDSASRLTGFSRRSEGTIPNAGPSRTVNGLTNLGNEAQVARLPYSSLRQRTAQACDKCRDRKTKCSGERPICKRCRERGMDCQFAPETRVRGHSRSKASNQIPAAELQAAGLDGLSLSSPTSNSSDEKLSTEGSASPTKSKHKARGSLSRSMAKKNLAAQRNSWPMGPPPSSAGMPLSSGLTSQVSLQIPVAALDSTDDDSWDSVWAQRDAKIDAAPVPGRAFGYEALLAAGFEYGSGSSRGSSPPGTISTSTSNRSSMISSIDSLDGLSSMLQSQLPAPEDANFTVEMYDLLNLPESTSSSSSGMSPASGAFEGEVVMDFTSAAYEKEVNMMDSVPHLALGHDDNYMSQFLNPDFYGMVN